MRFARKWSEHNSWGCLAVLHFGISQVLPTCVYMDESLIRGFSLRRKLNMNQNAVAAYIQWRLLVYTLNEFRDITFSRFSRLIQFKSRKFKCHENKIAFLLEEKCNRPLELAKIVLRNIVLQNRQIVVAKIPRNKVVFAWNYEYC